MPDFVCIGAQKAGTTWLHDNLAAHPNIWLPPVKELHYFDQLHVDSPGHRQAVDERRRAKAERTISRLRAAPDGAVDLQVATLIADGTVSDDWYRSVFGFAPSTALCGEITGAYALLPPEGIDHLVALAPDAKILFLVRDPIDRAWSQVRMVQPQLTPEAVRVFKPMATIELDTRVLLRSRYSETLRLYRARIEERSIWIGDFDQMIDDPAAFLESVCTFLGVDFDEQFFPDMRAAVHGGRSREIDSAAYEHLRAALESEYDELALMLPDIARKWKLRHYGGQSATH